MSGTYLVSSFADKDRVKALGARWDPSRRQWYVPEGRELAPFAQWLPADDAAPVPSSSLVVPEPATALVSSSQRGMPLSKLLQGVSTAVAQAFKSGVWVLVEVVDTRVRGGHVYLEVSERDASGVITAKATAIIWSSTASRILPQFEAATGAQVGPGIKLLIRARPVFKPQHGFSLEVDAIDPDYTLGDLEARKREIRERLKREGLFDLNRQLPTPWDYNLVLVVAPEDGAGLGDFQAEARRLEGLSICQFVYVHSRFQGDGAAAQIRLELLGAVERMREAGSLPDAVAIIRGDLAQFVQMGLAHLDAGVASDTMFDPMKSTAELRIHLTDIGEARFLPSLMAEIRREAPGIQVNASTWQQSQIATALDNGDIHLAIGFLPELKISAHERLLQDRYVVLLRTGHPATALLKRNALTVKKMQTMDLVAVRSHTQTLQMLRTANLERQIKLTTSTFLALPAIVRNTNLAALMPQAIARDFLPREEFTLLETDFPANQFTVSVHWSRRHEHSQLVRWARRVVLDLFKSP